MRHLVANCCGNQPNGPGNLERASPAKIVGPFSHFRGFLHVILGFGGGSLSGNLAYRKLAHGCQG